jgi:uncharacterized protein
MSGIGLYVVFLVPPLVLGIVVQGWLRKTVARYQAVETGSGLTGAQVARQILDRNGLQSVPVEPSPGGALSDHYDPRSRSVHLSPGVYDGSTIAAAAIGAHEVGHAIQHARAYGPFRLRSAMFPAVSFASQAWFYLLILGAVMNAVGMIKIAVLLYAVVVAFQLVTLPVEFDASRRAMVQVRELGLVTEGERGGARKVLTAAAMTYVAGALAALTQLLYFVLAYLGNRD